MELVTKIKKFEVFEDMPPIHYRDGTSDLAIIEAILLKQEEYKFPVFKTPPKLIFDIGANIGVVTFLLRRIYPTAHIVSFEPQKENIGLLRQNTKDLPGDISIVEYGLSDIAETVRLYPSDNDLNLGGYSTKIETDKPAQIVKLMSTQTAIETWGVPELIKIDTEGSEFAILNSFTDEQLAQVKWITGELHGISDFELLKRLDEHFKLQLSKNFEPINWHFNAINKNWTDFGKKQPQNNLSESK